MNILWVTVDRSNRVAKIFDPLQIEVSKIVNVTFIRKKMNMLASKYQRKRMIDKNLVDIKNANQFDFIMVDAPFAFINEDWDKIKVPKGLLIEDQHGPNPEYSKIYLDKGFDIFFTRYKNGLIDRHSHLKNSIIKWLPHSIDPFVFKDYKLEKNIDSLMVGRQRNRIYKLRNKINKKLINQSYYTRIERPSETVRKMKKWPVGIDYAKLINSAKITFTCSSIFNYVVLKFFEIPACRSALFSDYISEMGELGFEPNKNMIEVKGNIKNLVEKWLDFPKELKKISDNGFDLIHTRHTAKIRAEEFIGMLNNV